MIKSSLKTETTSDSLEVKPNIDGWTFDTRASSLLERDLTEEEKNTLPEGLLQFRQEMIAARKGKPEESEIEAISVVLPPFPGLFNFEASAIILSYSGYADEIEKLMHSLSTSTSKYFEEETKFNLQAYLLEWNPYIEKMIQYGFTWYDWNHSQDNPANLKAIPRYKRVKLTAINYKCVFDEGSLSAIQLEFKNMPPTPWI